MKLLVMLCLAANLFAAEGPDCAPGQGSWAGTYSLLHGTIGGKALVQVALRGAGNPNHFLSGKYFYEKHRKEISLEGCLDNMHRFLLIEKDEKGKVTGRFDGSLTNGWIELKGTWNSADGKRRLPFILRYGATVNERDLDRSSAEPMKSIFGGEQYKDSKVFKHPKLPFSLRHPRSFKPEIEGSGSKLAVVFKVDGEESVRVTVFKGQPLEDALEEVGLHPMWNGYWSSGDVNGPGSSAYVETQNGVQAIWQTSACRMSGGMSDGNAAVLSRGKIHVSIQDCNGVDLRTFVAGFEWK